MRDTLMLACYIPDRRPLITGTSDVNNDLADTFGNLVNRVLKFVTAKYDGRQRANRVNSSILSPPN